MKVKKTKQQKPEKVSKPKPVPDPIEEAEDSNDSSSDNDDDVPQAADPVAVNDTIISEMDVEENGSGDEAEEPKTKTSKKAKEKSTKEVKPEDAEEPKKIAYDKSEEPRTVFCGNIPNGPNINETRIKDLFGEYGTVKSVRFRSETGKVLFSKKLKKETKSFIAYVVFAKEEDAKSSIKLNGFKLLDNHLRVNMANNKKEAFSNKGTIFVGNLPFDSVESEIHEYFSQVGNIEYARKIANKGIAYVCFSKGVNISTALKLNDQPFKGRRLRISRCESRDKQDKKKLYKKDEKTGKRIKLRVKKAGRLNEEVVMRGKSNNNPIVKKIRQSQSAKYNKFSEKNQLTKKELFRRGGKMDQNQREDNREKGSKKKKFFGSKVDGIDKTKSKKSKVSKSLKQQKVIAKKLKSAASRVASTGK